jgi:hypothetical protein
MALAPPREYVVITSDQIYYCNTKDNPGCVIDTDGFYYPNLSVVRQFSGARNKQYVLLSAVNMRRGVTGSGYHIFQLAPKSKKTQGGMLSTASELEITMLRKPTPVRSYPLKPKPL